MRSMGPVPTTRPTIRTGPVGAPLGAHRQAVHGQLDVDALGGGDAVAAAGPDRLEHGLAGERIGQHAGEAPVGAERGGAGMAGARPALVAVGVRHDADLVAGLQRVLEQPLEATPVGVDLDDRLQRGVVEADDVGVAAADVGNQQHVVAAARTARRAR